MNLFYDGVLIAGGILTVYAAFKAMQFSGRIMLLLVHDRIQNETLRRISEDKANAKSEAQAQIELEAHNLMINDPMINSLVRDLADNPYIPGHSNHARVKLQSQLRHCVKNRSVREVMFNMQF